MYSRQVKLPHLGSDLFLTDGGLETTMVFHEGIDLPEFAAFDLLKDDAGTQLLSDYYRPYMALAEQHGFGFILESATWRANPDWAGAIGYELETLDEMNHRAVEVLQKLRRETRFSLPLLISGCVGPRDDGYQPARVMTAAEAQQYHERQIAVLVAAGADVVSALTMTNIQEAVGITRAAEEMGAPVVISFTVETDGHLPTGETLAHAINEVDRQTHSAPAYFMLNCAHPSHFETQLVSGSPWVRRIKGIQANASRCSHAELDEATELDAGDPQALAENYFELRAKLPQLKVLGGCCGTDIRHLAAIAQRCAQEPVSRQQLSA